MYVTGRRRPGRTVSYGPRVPVVPTAPVAAASLIAGYAVAAGTGIRPLGGAVLVAGTAWCAHAWARRRGAGVAAALVGVQAGAFAASHVLARPLGAWPAVLGLAALSAAAVALAADRGDRARPAPRPG